MIGIKLAMNQSNKNLLWFKQAKELRMKFKSLSIMLFPLIFLLTYGCSNPVSNDNDDNNVNNNDNSSNSIEELNYDNNVSYFSLHIGTPSNSKADLTIEGVSSPQHHLNSPSGSWDFNYRIVNMGQDQTANSSVVKIYLSNDNVLSSSDLLLLKQNISSLSVGDYEIKSANISIPSGYSNGSYLYVIVVADANNDVDELNEENNYNFFCLHIGTPSQSKPDLAIENLYSLQHHVNPGEGWNLSYRVQNMGQGDAKSSSNVKIYLSKDKYVSSNDYVIGEDEASAIAKGKYDNLNTRIKIPNGISKGYYFVLVEANAK